MTTAPPRPGIRRTCDSCKHEYRHVPVTADGIDPEDGEKIHVIACSWVCLEDQIHSRELCGAGLGDF